MDPIKTEGADSLGVLASLRKLIMDGRYPPGTRLAEIAVAEALGVSRTPIRLAFRTLEQEGLLGKAGKRGVVVRAFSEADVLCALEVRGVLEGLAARRLAERGLDDAVRATLQACVDDGERVLGKGYLEIDDIGHWSQLNDIFHSTIVGSTGSDVIADAIMRNNHLPFASAGSIVIDKQALDKEYEKLRIAQFHHRLVLDALVRGESARVEMLMREHAHVGLRYGELLGLTATSSPGKEVAPVTAPDAATVRHGRGAQTKPRPQAKSKQT
ncbi:GntR family transcriptional regulator [Cupriavidus basilensis]|uniref:GntR family transcriptional regulator n=1 Tax=Cupriavidus basilensis TaxID=68895 RepID=A0ABT6AP85_9BURK|nr:GntR family transcriptional regulator [Cupriavidus basilensis]MDF3834208.1 GntR family transcriptional regulator [Cupriavidus basilensis]